MGKTPCLISSWIFCGLIFGASLAQGICSVRWMPMDQQALVTMRNAGDNDPIQLYRLMNVRLSPASLESKSLGSVVPTSGSNSEPGKTIQTPDSYFTLVCDGKGSQCQMVFIKGPFVSISRALGKIEIRLQGSAAEELRRFFFQDAHGEIHYSTQDDRFFIESAPQHMQILFQDK